MRLWSLLCLLILICLSTSGCAVVMAANQPGQKNLDLLKVGMPRDAVMAEYGAPINSEVKDGEKTDVYKFRQGYSGGEKAFRSVAHGTADVFTLGLWEVVGTPAEAAMNGRDVAFKIIFDKDDKVKTVTWLAGK